MGTDSGLVFQIEIPVVDHRICQEAYTPLKRKVTRDMICAGEKEGKSRGRRTTGHHQSGRGAEPGSGRTGDLGAGRLSSGVKGGVRWGRGRTVMRGRIPLKKLHRREGG